MAGKYFLKCYSDIKLGKCLAGEMYFVGCFAGNNINSTEWCHGLVSVTAKEIVWSGFINETWTFQEDTLEQATTGKVFECLAGVAPNTAPFCKLEADTAIETSEFDITTKEWLYFAPNGASHACRIICNPTDLFQYSIRRKDTGSVILNHFNMRNTKICPRKYCNNRGDGGQRHWN